MVSRILSHCRSNFCLEVGGASTSCRSARLHRASWRILGLGVVMVAASFCFFLVSAPHRARLSFFIRRLPEYNDFLMPSNTSVPLSPTLGSQGGVHEPTGVTIGFLVHSPACSIPDFDPLDHTIKRFVSKPKPVICGKPPSFTSSRGSTLYLHHDILRLHFPVIQKIYTSNLHSKTTVKPKLTSKSPAKATTTTTPHPRTTTSPRTTTPHPRTTTSSRTTTPHPLTTTSHRITTPLHTTPSLTNTTPHLIPPPKTSTVSPSPPPSSSPPTKRRKRSAELKITPEDVKCCYKGIYRVQQKRKKADASADNRWRYNDTCNTLNNTTTKVEEDAALVECRIGATVVYKNVHYFFHREKFLSSPRVIIALSSNVQRASPSSGTLEASAKGNTQSKATNTSNHRLTSNDAASSQTPAHPEPAVNMHRVQDVEKLNVIIIGTDSASRLNMLRHLSKTHEYLTKELGALDLKGYNKVADNTFPNIVPVMTGFTGKEMDNHTCLTKSRHYDDCPFVWKDFKKNYYVTGFLEDAPWMGVFHYLRRGFIDKPTDYYGRPFMLASEKQIGGPQGGQGHICQGDILSLKVVQNYVLEFARAFLDMPFFGFFWASTISHDHMNMLNLADEPYLQLLQQMTKIGALNNTALFFLSDHGMRWGGIRSTYIGMMEERLPYLLFYLPPWFRKKYHQAYGNLVSNTHRLTSNFDIHKTLLDLAYGRFADHTHVTSKPSRSERGTSLFRNIPWNRTCTEANIPTHFCSCQDTHELTEDDSYLVPAANYFLDILNKELLPYPQCEQFTQIKVLSARVSIPSKELKPKQEKTEVRTYLLQASLTPGGGVMEASFRHTGPDNSFKITGTISRINKYGTTSGCVQDDYLRKICYCKDQAKAKQSYIKHEKETKGSEDGNNSKSGE